MTPEKTGDSCSAEQEQAGKQEDWVHLSACLYECCAHQENDSMGNLFKHEGGFFNRSGTHDFPFVCTACFAGTQTKPQYIPVL